MSEYNKIQKPCNELLGHGNAVFSLDGIIREHIPNSLRIYAEDLGLVIDPGPSNQNQVGYYVLSELASLTEIPRGIMIVRHFVL
jgi:hypothetical protein